MNSNSKELYSRDEVSRSNRKVKLTVVSSVMIIVMMNLAGIYFLSTQPFTNLDSIKNNATSLIALAVIYLLARRKTGAISVWLLISFFFIKTILCLYAWEVCLPAALLMTLLIAMLSSLFLNLKQTLLISLGYSVIVVLVSFLEGPASISINNLWQVQACDILTAVSYMTISIIIVFISFKNCHENLQKLEKIELNQAKLEKDKAELEIKVKERTDEVLNIKKDKIKQLQSLASIGHLSGGIFHDIINPLTVVNLNLEQIKSESKSLIPETKKYIQQALKASNRIKELIESVNNCLRRKNQEDSFSIQQEILEIVKIMQAKALKNHVLIETDITRDTYIKGASSRFGQVVMNLIANAIEASTESKNQKKIIIRLSLKKESQEIILEVIDQGTGISEVNLNNIFDTFFSTKKQCGHNSGIGLSVVKDIVEKDFRGKIYVRSQLNEGTTFRISFPSII